MILDAATRLSDGQALTTGLQLSSNVYDTSAAGLPRGSAIRLLVQVSVAFAGGTSLSAQLVEADDPAITAPNVLLTSATVGEAALAAGTKLFDVAVPAIRKRYLAIQYFSVGAHTAGAVVADFLFDTDSGVAFNSWTGL